MAKKPPKEKKKPPSFEDSSVSKAGLGQYSPDQDATLERFYLPILADAQPVEASGTPPVHLLGVKGGVGVTTLASVTNRPDLLLDFAQFDSRRQFVKYLPEVILVTNLTYASVLSLQGVLQQYTDATRFAKAGYTPKVLGVAVVDNTNCKKTTTVQKMLKHVTTGIPKVWNFKFIPTLQDVLEPSEAALNNAFYKECDNMVQYIQDK
jgi:hypothetical protein